MKAMLRISACFLMKALVLGLIMNNAALAVTRTWAGNGGTKDWSQASAWNPNGVPQAGDDVVVNGTGSATLRIDVNTANLGSFTLSAGSVVFDAGKILSINGNFSMTGGTFTPGEGTVQFLSGNATFTNSTANEFKNLTVNKGSGNTLTLTNSMVVNGTLTLTNGTIITGSNEVNVRTGNAGGVAIANGSVNGKVRRHLPNNASGTWLFTNANTSITPSSNSQGTVLIQSFPGTSIPVGDASKAINRYYAITQEADLTGDLRLAYLDSELNSLNEGLLSAWRYNGTTWVDEGGSVVPASDYVEVLNISIWSNWTLAESGGPLPIQLASAAAYVIRDSDVEVTWKTVSETNNFGFEIHRKRGDSGQWVNVGFVAGQGTTLEPQTYSYLDRSVGFGKYFYRIRQIDLDGTSETFPEMEVTVGTGPDKFVLTQNYPNPFNPATLIEFVVPVSGHTTMKVYNVLGQEVATLFDGHADAGRVHTARFDASKLSSGLYFYTLRAAGKSDTKRMLLTK